MNRRKFIKLTSLLPLLPIVGNTKEQDSSYPEIPNYTKTVRSNRKLHDDAMDSHSYFTREVLEAFDNSYRLGEIASKRMDEIMIAEFRKFNG